MITKQNTIRCDECGLFCKIYDSYVPFGCKNYEYPEPLDDRHICKKCFPKLRQYWIDKFKAGHRNGDYIKSRAEVEASKCMKLKWVGSGGTGVIGTNYFLDSYKYYPEKVYNVFSKLPYYGWCKICGSKRKGGYCGNKKCSESFNPNKGEEDYGKDNN